jgi:tetratricopeptide (TPR) repeat protein
MKNNTEVKNQLKIMEKITLNIKYYTDYERGFLIWAYLMMMNDNFNKAEDHIKKVLLLNKAQIKAYEYSAMIKYRQGKHEESCSKYEKAWEYSNTNNANIGHKLAVSYINCKQHIKALNVCNEIKRKFPNYPIDDVYQQAKNALDNDRIS